jgi:hypothetical protein
MTPYEFGRFIKLATQPASFAPSTGLPVNKPALTQYEKTWEPTQTVLAGRGKLIPPATPDMLQPGNKGGVLRPMVKKERQHTFGRPEFNQAMRQTPDGPEVYNPQAAYDARPNDT